MENVREIYLEKHLIDSLPLFHPLKYSFPLPALANLLGSNSSSSSTSSLEHRQSSQKLNASSNSKKTMSKSPSVSSRASAGIYGFFNQAFLVFFILVCL